MSIILCAGLAGGQAAAEAPGKTVTFHIADSLAGDQVDEQIAISINHLPVGTLHVNAQKTKDTLTVTVPVADMYVYDLCGELVQHDADGKTGTHKIDNEGLMPALDGRHLTAYNIDASIFYLIDETPGQPPSPARLVRGAHGCSDTVAMLAPGEGLQLR
jgi:hypothetical protein